MYKELLNKIQWCSPKLIYTKDGKKRVQEAALPEGFWEAWKIHREKIKESGISVSKFQGKWRLVKWIEIAEEPKKDFEKINLETKILYDYQIEHAKILISDLIQGQAALDASDTGTGKTFCALEIAKNLKLHPIVITPKSVIPSWIKVAKLIGVNIFVSNYEQYKAGKTKFYRQEETVKKKGLWTIPENSLLIFDECHRTKNPSTQNSEMLISAKKTGCKILCLSATIADNPLQLYALGLVLELFENRAGFYNWATKRGVHRGWFGMEFKNTQENLNKIHKDIFPSKGSRIAIKDLGDKFPDNLIITDTYEMNSAGNKIQQIYDNMRVELYLLSQAKEKDGSSVLTEILRARQEIELLKAPTFVELAEDHLAENHSVVIFVNFEQTVQALKERLKTDCVITGKISNEERDKNIQNFQDDKERIIICNIKAGGVGISLHDLNGKYSRVSLISPTYSAQDLKQALGRIHRAGAKSGAIQKIIFAAGTIEEDVAEKVAKKIKNIDTINDGDLN